MMAWLRRVWEEDWSCVTIVLLLLFAWTLALVVARYGL